MLISVKEIEIFGGVNESKSLDQEICRMVPARGVYKERVVVK